MKSFKDGFAYELKESVQTVPNLMKVMQKNLVKNPDASVETASDNFTTVNGGLLEKCIINLEPVQSGSGDPSPDNICPISGHTQVKVGDDGKNKLRVTMATTTSQGITATVYDDGTVLINGTSTGTCILTLNNTLTLNGDYILSGCPSGGDAGAFRMDCYWTGQGALIDSGNGVAISPNGNAITTRIIVMQGVTVNNLLFKPMIRLASDTDPTFVPYNGYQVTVNLGGTYYSGTLDVVSGELTVDSAFIASYNGETLPSTWISDRDVYAVGTTPTTGAEVCYKLATPQTIQLTPQQIEALVGKNNLSCPLEGQSIKEVNYREIFTFSDVKAYSDAKAAAVLPEDPAEDGTYTLKLTKSGSTITKAWTADTP